MQIGAHDAHVEHIDAERLGLRDHRLADLMHEFGAARGQHR
jgi:hypothetical protein